MSSHANRQAAGDVQVRTDDRARLMGALLAATRAPEMAQARAKHGTHAHARATRRRVQSLRQHPAALAADALLGQGMTVVALFALAFALDPVTLRPVVPAANLPPALEGGLADFAHQAGLAGLWAEDADAWERSTAEAKRAFAGVVLGPFLDQFFGATAARLTFLPNLSYPADEALALAAHGELIAVVPPPAAWGESPPWPYDEDPAHVLGAAITAYSRLRLDDPLRGLPEDVLADVALPVSDKFRRRYPVHRDQLAQVFSAGLVGLYLREQLGEREAGAWVLMEQRLRGVDKLPAAVAVLERFRSEPTKNRAAALAKFLPRFPELLREEAGL